MIRCCLIFVLLVPVLMAGCALITPKQREADMKPDVKHLRIQSERALDWEALFQQPHTAWRGSDAIYSVPITPTRTLWIFGDTWLFPDQILGISRSGCTMVGNTLADQRLDGPPAPASANSPAPLTPQTPTTLLKRDASFTTPTLGGRMVEEPRFFWRKDAKGQVQEPLLPAEGKGKLWSLGGLRLADKLYLFMSHVVEVNYGIGAEGANSRLLIVANPDAPLADWRIEQVNVPYFRHTSHGDRIFGTACLEKDGYVYIYGVREDWRRGANGRDLILARAENDAFVRKDFAAWRFYSEDGWTPDLEKAARLFNGAASEMSVSYLPGLHRYVAVYTHMGNSPEILGRFAERPEGPWSDAVVLHKAHDENWSSKWFYYAGKAHPELASNDNELLITYATNAQGIEDVANDLRLYWPRFVRVTIDKP